VTQTILAPVQKSVSNIFAPVGRFFSDVKNFGKTSNEIKELKSQNAELKKQVILNKDIQGQLTQLRGALDLAARANYKVVSARVIGRGSASTFSQTISIDAGTADHVSINETVISANGLVGVVKSVESHSAIVLLMNDPAFRIGVRDARTQSVGVLIGQGSNEYQFQLLDPTGEIKVGDSLISNGSDGNRPFIPGLPVGYVTSVDHTSASLTQSATVKAYANLSNIGVVSVVISAPTAAPRSIIQPTPIPTVTVYVTPAPVATPSATPSPTGSGH
jgi:rod shape-determining protein MreC